MNESPDSAKAKYQLAGWLLFILCALCYMASSWRNQDTLAFMGSILFLLACVVFLLPLVMTGKGSAPDAKALEERKKK